MGEYWNDQNAESLKKYIGVSQGLRCNWSMHHFITISIAFPQQGRDYDISKIFEKHFDLSAP
jgi:hypothetical protein